MDVSRRRAAPSKRMQVLININAELQDDNAKLAKANTDLIAERDLLKQKNKTLRIVATLLLASSASLGVGMGTSMLVFSPGAALTSAITVFFAVITVAVTILNYLSR